MISQHPEVEAKVLAELDSLELLCTATRQHPRAMLYEDIAKLNYTHNAIRVCRPAPEGFRSPAPLSLSCPQEQ